MRTTGIRTSRDRTSGGPPVMNRFYLKNGKACNQILEAKNIMENTGNQGLI